MNDPRPHRGLPHITDLLLKAALDGKFSEDDKSTLRDEFNYQFSDGILYIGGLQDLTKCIAAANVELAKTGASFRLVLSDFNNEKRGTGYGEIIFYLVQLDIVDATSMNILNTAKIADTTDRYSC